MWARQMDPQVKRAARPDNARSQSKTVTPSELKFTYPKHPKARMSIVENSGRPDLST